MKKEPLAGQKGSVQRHLSGDIATKMNTPLKNKPLAGQKGPVQRQLSGDIATRYSAQRST